MPHHLQVFRAKSHHTTRRSHHTLHTKRDLRRGLEFDSCKLQITVTRDKNERS